MVWVGSCSENFTGTLWIFAHRPDNKPLQPIVNGLVGPQDRCKSPVDDWLCQPVNEAPAPALPTVAKST